MYATNWNTLGPREVQALKDMDRKRQARGHMLERVGYGPQATPSAVIHAEPGLNVRRFGAEGVDGPALLIVPAPIKRAYIWDLAPEVSVVRRWLERGYRVYQAEWLPLSDASQDFGLEDYGSRLLEACRQAIEADGATGQGAKDGKEGKEGKDGKDGKDGRLVVAGHSLGGILAAVYSCLHPQHVRATILLESPLHVESASCCFNPLVKATPHAREVADAFGHVPGAFLNMMSAIAEPHAFQWERAMDRWLSLFDPQALATHMRVERWTHDEFPLPGRLFTQVIESLYRNDEFMQGKLEVGGRAIGPADLRAPLAAVVDPRSKLIPLKAMAPFVEAAGSEHKLLLEYMGDVGVNLQHVGVLVGRNAHARTWPAIFDWLASLPAQDQGGAAAAPR